MKLVSDNPQDAPLLDPNLTATEANLNSMESAIRICRDIGRQDALDPWRKREVFPGPKVQDKTAMRVFIPLSATSYNHQVGNRKLGLGEDAIVDLELRVRGLRSLRVVNASIMPEIVSGNTNAPTITIVQKAADMMRTKGVTVRDARASSTLTSGPSTRDNRRSQTGPGGRRVYSQ